MRDLHLTFLPRLYLASLALLAACDSLDAESSLGYADLDVNAVLEQPGDEDEQVVHVVFHRDGRFAKRSLTIWAALLAEARAPVEHVSLGELVPEDDRDVFEHAKLSEFGLTGQVTLAPCPGGVACRSVFSCVVTSRAPAPGLISLNLLGSFTFKDSEDPSGFLVELQVAP